MEASARATVLIVDDTVDNLSLIGSFLKDLYQIKAANNGAAALRIALSASPPDLILLDIMMPGMDGYEVCRRLKADPRSRDIPVIFLTARSSVDDEKFGLDLGAVDYIGKPISPPVVLARVKNHLSLKASADSLRASLDTARAAHAQLEKAQKHLIQTEKMAALGQLVIGVAHEINTPVGNALMGATYLAELLDTLHGQFLDGALRRSELAEFLEGAREVCGLLTTNIVRTTNLIQSFKQVAADRSGSVRRRFDLKDYIGDALLGIESYLDEAECRLTVSCPAGLVLDSHPGPLAQVLLILVRNAVTHAYAPGQAGRLSLDVSLHEDDTVELRFADGGKGIAPDHLPKLFDPFFTTRRGNDSTGLGLYIAFNLVTQVLQGTIAVDSVQGSGATFTLRFPRVLPDGDGGTAPSTISRPDPSGEPPPSPTPPQAQLVW
ncbi:response regulator [Azospirillum sp. TSO22-1]|uniref:sensor histidine kinase n=1 Tax=Azospirillum sp. TSO22-1 TaxID=716789 RepID=UPI000D64CAFA|nr:response regulator [Azospirillum sp. TSO22-1]